MKCTSNDMSFPLVGISDFQWVGNFPGIFELVVVTECSVKKMVSVFLDSENNVRMVTVRRRSNRASGFPFFSREAIIDIPVIEWWVVGCDYVCF